MCHAPGDLRQEGKAWVAGWEQAGKNETPVGTHVVLVETRGWENGAI